MDSTKFFEVEETLVKIREENEKLRLEIEEERNKRETLEKERDLAKGECLKKCLYVLMF